MAGVSLDTQSWLNYINPLTNLTGAIIALFFLAGVIAAIIWILRTIAAGVDRAVKVRILLGVFGVIAIGGIMVPLVNMSARTTPGIAASVPTADPYDVGKHEPKSWANSSAPTEPSQAAPTQMPSLATAPTQFAPTSKAPEQGAPTPVAPVPKLSKWPKLVNPTGGS